MTLNKISKKIRTFLFLVFWLYSFVNVLHSQDFNVDSLDQLNIYQNRYEYLLDDTYLLIGVNSAGIYKSNNFRNLDHSLGFLIGMEQLYPIGRSMVLNAGLNFAQKNFNFSVQNNKIRTKNLFMEFPINTSMELPILKEYNLRIFFGATFGMRLYSNIKGAYDRIVSENPDTFIYERSDFNRFDFGYQFGLNMEYKDLLFRVRSYTGLVKLDNKDQGMLNTFQFETGYYIFRKSHKIK